MKTFTCNIAQPGLFAGNIVFINNEVKTISLGEGKFEAGQELACGSGKLDEDQELTAFQDALNQLKKELERGDFNYSNSEIIEALKMIVEDEAFAEGVQNTIMNNHCSAAEAVEKQRDSIVSEFEASGSDYLRGRCDDIRGLSKRLIEILRGKDGNIQISKISAIASMEISPILIASIKPEYIGALVSDKGAPNSHASIMAGNLGVPYLYDAGKAISQMENGQKIIVDGDRGNIILDPDDDIFRKALEKMKALVDQRESFENNAEKNAEKIFCRTKIMANISGPEDVPNLLKAESDGVGLLRTELIFLNSPDPPTEEKQLSIYTYVLEAMKDKEVIIRTMDLGSDKTAEWLDLPKENNPALGLRGARVSLERRDLLNTQLRALLRAGVKGNLKIMFPMIISEWEVDELKKAVNDVAKELENEGMAYAVPKLGIMIETPSAVMIADKLAEKVSFFSIGTNDLTQYTLGIDRENEELGRFFDSKHESVLRLIELTVQRAHEKGISVGICGQLAADPKVINRLVNCGIDELSVPIANVKAVRKNVAQAEKEISDSLEKLDLRSCTGTQVEKEISDSLEIFAVADGEIVPMNAIPDETFSSGLLGPCVGILPENGNVYSPCDGSIISVAETKHAIVIETEDKTQYLVHMGIDTVNMKGNVFEVKVNIGQSVRAGELIAVADLRKIEKEGFSTIIVTVRMT